MKRFSWWAIVSVVAVAFFYVLTVPPAPGQINGGSGPPGPTGASGSPGQAGSQIWNAAGIPNPTLGADTDIYVNTLNANVYQKQSGAWVGPTMNLTGPQGSAGATGATGSAGTNGTNGSNGATGATGPTGPVGANAFGTPNVLSPVFATVTQCTDTTKPCVVSAMIRAAYTISVLGTQADTDELRIGSSSTNLCAASSPTGTSVATFEASLTGIAISVGMAQISRNQLSGFVPTGWFWCLRRVSGTTSTIASATDQSLG